MFTSAFCFHSGLILSHVPRKVLISSLPLEFGRLSLSHTCTNSHKNAFAYTDSYASHTDVLCAHTYLMHALCGHILSFKHVSHERKWLHLETLISTPTLIKVRQITTQITQKESQAVFLLYKSIYILCFMTAECKGSSN